MRQRVQVLGRAVAVLAALATCTGAAAGQFASTTELVEVYLTVTDAQGQPVTGLPAGAFTVLEDGVPQPVTVFTAGNVPLTIALAVDRSFSMTVRGLDTARAGAGRLLNQLRPVDRVQLLAIGGGIDTLSGFDAPRETARRALERLTLWGSSPIGDVVVQALASVEAEQGRRAVVIWSDGAEREAQRSRAEVLQRVRTSGALVYPVAIGPSPSPLLAELAALSGGRLLAAKDRRAAEQAGDAIALELRQQYLLGYAPPEGAAGWRRIEVRVNRPELRVRARQGYMAKVRQSVASS